MGNLGPLGKLKSERLTSPRTLQCAPKPTPLSPKPYGERIQEEIVPGKKSGAGQTGIPLPNVQAAQRQQRTGSEGGTEAEFGAGGLEGITLMTLDYGIYGIYSSLWVMQDVYHL